MYPSSNNKNPHENYYTPSPSSFHLPSPTYIPLEDEAVFCEFFQQQQFFSTDDHNCYHNSVINPADDMTANMESTMGECSNTNEQVAMNDGDDDQWDHNTDHLEPAESSSPRKRTSKGDRHSKINTARGPRDRRMRLSLDVAKKLFGLQDLLGFDKASKTVDWLLTKSKTAILELRPDPNCSFMGVSNSTSSTSECDDLSGTGTGTVDQSMLIKTKSSSGSSSKKQNEKVTREVIRRCTDFHHPLAKATRERARARARERTIEKRNYKNGGGGGDQVSEFRPFLDPAMDQDVNPSRLWSPSEDSQRHSCNDQLDRMSSNFQINQGFVGDNSSLLMTGNWSPSYLFNNQHTSEITHEHQFNDFQLIGKAWEDNDN